MVTSVSFSQSILNYQTGTTIDVQTGASVCADSVVLSGTFTGGGTICGLLYTLNLSAIIEGFYNAATDIMINDTATVYLRNTTSPYAIVESDKAVLNSSGAGTFTFGYAVNGINYYIVVRHRNSIETWSKISHSFSANSLSYNFIPTATQAYGDNMALVDISPLTFALFSGDVNQDGLIDATDNLLIDNDVSLFATGYLTTDVNGDDVTDASDAVIANNNASNFVVAVFP